MIAAPAPPILCRNGSCKELEVRGAEPSDRFSYKLLGGPGSGGFGLDVALGDDFEVDEGRMSLNLLFASGERRDGVGDLLEVGGIRTERHRKNPVILLDHGKQVALPIALAEDPDTREYTVNLDQVTQQATARIFFYQGKSLNAPGLDKEKEFNHAILCSQIFDLMAKRYLRGGSVGYQIVHAKQLPPDYETGTPQGLHLLSILMLEASAVVMPAHPETVMKGFDPVREILAMPTICGKRLSPYLVKSLVPYLPERTKTQVGCEGKKQAMRPDEERYRSIMTADAPHEVAAMGLKECACGCGGTCGCGKRALKALRLRARGKSTPVPLRSVRDYDSVPPSHYKPGPGAAGHESGEEARMHVRGEGLKALRRQYRKAQPSEKISPEKAKIILEEGEARGHKLTEKQRRMFQAAAHKGFRSLGDAPAAHRCQMCGEPASVMVVDDDDSSTGAGWLCDRCAGAAERQGVQAEDARRTVVKGLSADEKRLAVEFFPSRTQARQFAEELRRTGHRVSRFTEDERGQWLVYFETEPGKSLSVKALRLKYRSKAGSTLSYEHTVFGKEDVPQSGDTLIVRERLLTRDLSDTFARPGDRVKVVEMRPNRVEVIVRNAEGAEERFPLGRFRKSLPITAVIDPEVKSFFALRKKYRPVKGLRRRLRKSAPGSSVLRVRGKDIDAVQSAAEKCGLKFARMADAADGTVKVKLTGMDEQIDRVAQAHGLPLRRKA